MVFRCAVCYNSFFDTVKLKEHYETKHNEEVAKSKRTKIDA